MPDIDPLDVQLDTIRATRESKTINPNSVALSNGFNSLESNTVTKSNALARAYYRLNLNEKRLFELLVSKLNPMRSDNPEFVRVTVSEFYKTYSLDQSSAYSQLEIASKSLIRRVATVHYPRSDNSAPDVREMPLMQEGFYSKGGGYVEFSFNPSIVSHLVLLRSKFSSYSLKNAKDFKSIYTWRAYEYLVSWSTSKGLLKGQLNNIDLVEFRKNLGVPDSYRFSMFKKKCLDVIQLELLNKCSITVDFQLIKTSRKYTHINITFSESDQIPLL